MAFVHETKYENARAAFAAYEQLELYYNKDKEKRENNLYNLVRTSSLIGEVFATEEYGGIFLKTFPDSKHVPAVRRMMLTSLFYEGEYEKCIEVASVMIDKLPKNSLEHDICLHVLGGSYYYTGAYDKAQPLLDQHVEEYPKSKFNQAALYFQASNLSRLQFWAKAAKLLDAFFEKYPDPAQNVFFPFALFDRANCHYAENEFDPALDKLNRLEKDFPTAEVMDMAYNLKGNVLQTKEQLDEAESYYKKALELSERRENRAVSAEALYYLVAMLGEEKRNKEDNPRIKDAVPYADKFWQVYPDSPYKTQVAVSQIHALDAVGRGEEALERLRDVIGEMASQQQAVGLEEAINSYTEAYLEKHKPEELKEHYYNFPKIRAADKAARALLRIAVIGVFEEVHKKTEDPAEKTKAEAMIKVLFQELKGDFDPKDLTSYILIRLGDYLRTKTSAPRQALPYYDEALSRPDQSYLFQALFGRADVYAGGTSEEMGKAEADLKRVFDDSQDRVDRERALYRIIQVNMKKEAYDKAEENARLYLDPKGLNFSQNSPHVGLILAQTYDKRGMVNDALAMYAKVWSAHMGYIEVSAPAMKRWMELSWDRNLSAGKEGKDDRQGAYEGGWNYLDLTRRFFDKMTEKEQEMWREIEKLVATYENTPGIKSMAVIKAEKEKAAGR
jgi:tetratricopeptide (TPR) repeat protein